MSVTKAKSFCRFCVFAFLVLSVSFEVASFMSQLVRGLIGESQTPFLLIDAESAVFYAPSFLTPALVSIILFCWIPLFAVRLVVTKVRSGLATRFPSKVLEQLSCPSRLDRYSLLIAVLSISSVLIIALYPYFPPLNPWGKFVGVDIPFYQKGLLDLAGAGDPFAVLQRALLAYRDRPLTYLILLSTWRLTWLQPMEFVKFYPILLVVALVSVVYFSSRLMGLSKFTSSMVMLFTSFSFHVTTGMYGGFIANLTALVIMYPFWGLTIAATRKKSWVIFAGALLANSLMLLAHAYTWAMNVGVLFFYVMFSFLENLKREGRRFDFLMSMLLLVLSVIPFLLSIALMNVDISGTDVYRTLVGGVSIKNLQSFQSNLLKSVMSYKGSTFINPFVFAFSLVGLLVAFFSEQALSRLLRAFAVGSSIIFVAGNYVIQSRVLYNVPFQILALVGLFSLILALRRSGSCFENSRLGYACTALIALLFILINLNYALRCAYILTTINFFPGSMM
ncbi:MAG: hypothetical protein QFX35_05905 [Candidatus Verstraetearchaeota archaeon]|nr:hypothetical protein [Candidatus Verstraetearchaeota archaeon]